MPKLTVPGKGTFEIAMGTKLVLALEDNGIDISHRCGGNAKCTTCRVEFVVGEPDKMTTAEKLKLQERLDDGDHHIIDSRLSCQILVDQDMTVTPKMLVKDMKWEDPGDSPMANLTPNPEWGDNLKITDPRK